MRLRTALAMFNALLALAVLSPGSRAGDAPYAGWKHCGSLFILTTPEGANLPATASESNFPLLVRLHKDYFDFGQARPNGEDLRFSSSAGTPLAYQIEEWDAANGHASVWARIPAITGNARQEIRLHWGKADAASESNGAAVFNEKNGYLSVWHMNEPVKDEIGTLTSKDTGTTAAAGVIGNARRFTGRQGIFCGDKIATYPSGDSAHSSEVWFRIERPNATILGWGNEGGGRGSKVRMQFRSPPHIRVDSDFADVVGKGALPMREWIHVAHTYSRREGKIYINGRLDGAASPKLDIKTPARMWIGGWYNSYDFVGEMDEVRISKVARSADWVKLEYENQKPLQTLAGMVVQPGGEFWISKTEITIAEGKTATVEAKAGGAQKVYWVLKRNGAETVVAVDRFTHTLDAGRVSGDRSLAFQFRAVYASGTKSKDVALTIKEDIPDPEFTLQAPATWDGRAKIEVTPRVANLAAMQAKGAGEMRAKWSCAGMAVIQEATPEKLILKRAQNSGRLTVRLQLDNGGALVEAAATIEVKEPAKDAWVERIPAKDEKPEDNQFYARDDKNEGTLHCNGALEQDADSVFLRIFADDKSLKTESQKPGAGKSYVFAVKLKPGLIKYRVELGTMSGGKETILHKADNLVCGDAYLIEGQSNALATDTREESPRETNDWIRSYADPRHIRKGEAQNLWCNPVWKAQKDHKAELGWWGMELAKRLLESQKIPVFIINGAVGGTRIDQHQRKEANPADLSTIYGRLLWRAQQARLTHGIRAVLWHQGESDQGAGGPTGGYGWETYQQDFVDMSAAWKQDFPNLQRYYVFQIWPNACGMGNGNGDMLREAQRTLPRLYSNMEIMSTLGIKPPGPCHYPLTGWAEFARLIQPLIERDFYGKTPAGAITPPILKQASFTSAAKDAIALEFNQPVLWADALAGEFYLDGAKEKVASGSLSGNVLTLRLKEASEAQTITYLKEMSWSQERLLVGANGIAALTFCNVPIQPAR